MKINLTDQELNEWVATKVMGWEYKESVDKLFYSSWITNKDQIEIFDAHPQSPFDFNPSSDLNHTRLMEEKIKELEINKQQEYIHHLTYLNIDIERNKKEKIMLNFRVIHASARQRCEAAWLTFQVSN